MQYSLNPSWALLQNSKLKVITTIIGGNHKACARFETVTAVFLNTYVQVKKSLYRP